MRAIRNGPHSSPQPVNGSPDVQEDRDLCEPSLIAFFTLDRRGRICELNDKGAKLLGFSASWLLGRAFVVFIARQDVSRFLDFLTHSLRSSGQPQTIDVDIQAGEKTLPVQISLTTMNGGPSLHRMSVVDMTDIRQTEKLLEQSFTNWFSLVHNAPDTIMTVDASGRIALVNKPLWGYSAQALAGTNLCDYLPEIHHEKIRRCLEESFQYKKRAICELRGVDVQPDRWFSFSFGLPHPGASARPATTTATITLVIREISESKRTEETLRSSGEQMRDFAARLEAVREEERTRVAREIHDELGQALTVLKLDLAWLHLKTATSPVVRKKLKEMIGHVDDTIGRVRRISSELRPPILDDLGLVPAIEWQVAQFRKRTKIRTSLISQAEDLQLPPDTAAAVFRVVQEALTNVMRHADATRLRIKLQLTNEVLKISIQDNGRGMTPRKERKSLGIVGMKERISRLGGDLNIFSEPGKGTLLDMIIPAHHD